ncbi:MAG: extensin family protein [Gammaproteobacteria bacterium]|jgi:hypothetical protein
MHWYYKAIVAASFQLILASTLSADSDISFSAFDPDKTSTCEAELRSRGATFQVLKPIDGPGQCGSPRPLRLTKLQGGVALPRDVTLRCEMALALANWVSEVVIPSAKLHMKSEPAKLDISTSYQCRHRNGEADAKMSEHAYANAVDLMGISFKNGDTMKIQERINSAAAVRAFQAAVRGGACAYFTTVIGPTTNKYHANHLHLDLAERRNGFRLCE